MSPARWLPLLVFATACQSALAPEHLCDEVGYAIAGRTFECTGDQDLANQRFEALERDYTCVAPAPPSMAEAPQLLIAYEDLFHCPFALRNLPCELEAEFGGDLDAWLAASPLCRYIVEPRP